MDPFTLAMMGGSMLTSYLGNRSARSGAEQSAATQAAAARQAGDMRGRGYDEAGRTAGQGYDRALGALGTQRWDATNQLYDEHKPGGFERQQETLRRTFSTDPGYQFRMQQGTAATARGLNARGVSGGGNYDTALARYGQDYASNEYGNHVGRYQQWQGQHNANLQQMAGAERSGASERAGLHVNRGNALAQYGIGGADARAEGVYGAGQARAQGQQNVANADASMWNNFGNALSYGGGRMNMGGGQGQQQGGDSAWNQQQRSAGQYNPNQYRYGGQR